MLKKLISAAVTEIYEVFVFEGLKKLSFGPTILNFYKCCSKPVKVKPNPMKLDTIITIYSVINRGKRRDRSNGLGDRAIWQHGYNLAGAGTACFADQPDSLFRRLP